MEIEDPTYKREKSSKFVLVEFLLIFCTTISMAIIIFYMNAEIIGSCQNGYVLSIMKNLQISAIFLLVFGSIYGTICLAVLWLRTDMKQILWLYCLSKIINLFFIVLMMFYLVFLFILCSYDCMGKTALGELIILIILSFVPMIINLLIFCGYY